MLQAGRARLPALVSRSCAGDAVGCRRARPPATAPVRRQRPLEPLRVNLLLPRSEIVPGQRRECLLVNGVETLTLRPQWRIKSAGCSGDRLQARLVEMGFYELSGVVLDEAAALVGRHRDQVAVRRANATA